jgi:hypothetical protein
LFWYATREGGGGKRIDNRRREGECVLGVALVCYKGGSGNEGREGEVKVGGGKEGGRKEGREVGRGTRDEGRGTRNEG